MAEPKVLLCTLGFSDGQILIVLESEELLDDCPLKSLGLVGKVFGHISISDYLQIL